VELISNEAGRQETTGSRRDTLRMAKRQLVISGCPRPPHRWSAQARITVLQNGWVGRAAATDTWHDSSAEGRGLGCAMGLTSEEGRVLGCLVEKQLTTPQLYPLTENALIAACNQTTNRDPVVAYDVSTVRIATRSLREKGLLRMVHRTGERSDKHQHLLDSSLALSPGQVTLLSVLLLRGPQTLAELRARSERMYPFDTVAQVQEALDVLIDRDDPLVAHLERQPGRKEARYGHLLVDVEPAHVRPFSDQAAAPDRLTLVGLAREVELLRSELAELRTQVDGLRDGTDGD
jgi:uncharacterized protein